MSQTHLLEFYYSQIPQLLLLTATVSIKTTDTATVTVMAKAMATVTVTVEVSTPLLMLILAAFPVMPTSPGVTVLHPLCKTLTSFPTVDKILTAMVTVALKHLTMFLLTIKMITKIQLIVSATATVTVTQMVTRCLEIILHTAYTVSDASRATDTIAQTTTNSGKNLGPALGLGDLLHSRKIRTQAPAGIISEATHSLPITSPTPGTGIDMPVRGILGLPPREREIVS